MDAINDSIEFKSSVYTIVLNSDNNIINCYIEVSI